MGVLNEKRCKNAFEKIQDKFIIDDTLGNSTDKNYNCPECDFISSTKSEFKKHLALSKHIKLIPAPEFTCNICAKEFKSRQSLWYHKSKCCNTEIKISSPSLPPLNEDIKLEPKEENLSFEHKIFLEFLKNNNEIIKHNQEMQKIMMQICLSSKK